MILMNDFKAEPAELREAMFNAAKRVIESGWYILGKELESFEQQWARTCGLSHGVGVANGMDAIEISLKALNIGPGDEVITTPMTAFASILAILRAGATPVLADIDPKTALQSIESTRRCIGKNTKAILLVHLYGQLRQMDEWQHICQEYGIHLLEDCAQAHLASSKNKVAGSFGVVGAYSFYPTKNLGALGDAGIVVTDDDEIARKSKQLRNYGQSVRYHHPETGMNSRLDEIQAAFLSERIKWLESFTNRRKAIAQKYNDEIKNPLIHLLSAPETQNSHVYHLYVITCSQRSALQTYLQNKVQTLIHYPICIHHQEPCLNIKRDPYGLHNSEHHANTCLSLPCHPQMSDEDIEAVIMAINTFKGL